MQFIVPEDIAEWIDDKNALANAKGNELRWVLKPGAPPEIQQRFAAMKQWFDDWWSARGWPDDRTEAGPGRKPGPNQR